MRNDPITELVNAALASVPGVAAVVLGGSRARGTATPDSDHDFGLYYESEVPIDVAALKDAITPHLDDPRECTITPIGEWGPRINGGAWLSIDGHKVDLLYRDLNKVRTAIEDCRAGRIVMDYQPGHPHGFCSSIYAGEIATCRPLSDPNEVVDRLKAQTLPFPAALKQAVIAKFQWESPSTTQRWRSSAASRPTSPAVRIAHCVVPHRCYLRSMAATSSTKRRRSSRQRHFP